jgi:hypothetical protein
MDVNDENAPSMLNSIGTTEACGKQRTDIEPCDDNRSTLEISQSKVIALENNVECVDQTPIIITSKKFIHKKLLVHQHHQQEKEQREREFSNINEIMSENKRQHHFAHHHDEEDVWRPW